MIGTFLALTVAQALPAAEKAVRAPSTLDVVILSKRSPRSVSILSGGCRAETPAGESLIRVPVSLQWRRGQVRVCGAGARRARKCADRPHVVLRCKGSMTLSIPKLKPRTYGQELDVRAGRSALRMIAKLDRERYVAGVVQAELTAAPPEAQIAQAVVARTFALRALVEPRHDDAPLCDLTHCQVYSGAKRISARASRAPPRALVDHQGEISPAYFHSTCGGRTVSARAVWGDRETPDVVGIADVDGSGRAWCRRSPHFGWVHELEATALAGALEKLAGRALDPASLSLTASDDGGSRWVISDKSGLTQVTGAELHRAFGRILGWSAVKSSLFVARRAGRSFRLSGRGLGHRAGLCQHGALARARAGQTAAEIIRAYFPKLELVQVVTEDPPQ